MTLGSSYQKTLNEIAEIGIWASPFINIGDAENLTCREFDFYKDVYKEKFEKEQENRQEIIKKAFEFAADCTKSICRTIAGVFGKRR